MTMYSKNLATTIEIDHRQRETIFSLGFEKIPKISEFRTWEPKVWVFWVPIFKTYNRTAVQHNGKKLSTIQKSFPHGQWVDHDCDSMISGMKSKAGFQKNSTFG